VKWPIGRIPHAVLDGLAQRHRTPPPRLTPQPTNRRPTASATRARHASHVVELCTSHHVLELPVRLQLRDKFLRNSERISDELSPKAVRH
jgi:hypothetical protein